MQSLLENFISFEWKKLQPLKGKVRNLTKEEL